jgi:hypothetical protein
MGLFTCLSVFSYAKKLGRFKGKHKEGRLISKNTLTATFLEMQKRLKKVIGFHGGHVEDK